MRLPGQPDRLTPGLPDAFMSGLEMAGALEHYAAAIKAPIRSGVRVVSLRYTDPGYEVLVQHSPDFDRISDLASGYHLSFRMDWVDDLVARYGVTLLGEGRAES